MISLTLYSILAFITVEPAGMLPIAANSPSHSILSPILDTAQDYAARREQERKADKRAERRAKHREERRESARPQHRSKAAHHHRRPQHYPHR